MSDSQKTRRKTSKPKIVLARQYRKALTPPEHLLWDRLKTRDGSGLIFRRQHPIGPYILDFYCAKVKLCIEVDGAIHGVNPERDIRRDAWLSAYGIETYRILASDVFANPDDVADGIKLKAFGMLNSK